MKKAAIAKAVGTVVLVLAISPFLAYKFPALYTMDQSYLVLSGSMVPTFEPGAIIFNEKVRPRDLEVGDVVTYRAAQGSKTLYTHRIVAIERTDTGAWLTTKGDANEDIDKDRTHESLVLSRYVFHVPYYGNVFAFTRTPIGFITLVVIPAAAIIIWQLRNVALAFLEIERAKMEKKTAAAKQPPEGGNPP